MHMQEKGGSSQEGCKDWDKLSRAEGKWRRQALGLSSALLLLPHLQRTRDSICNCLVIVWLAKQLVKFSGCVALGLRALQAMCSGMRKVQPPDSRFDQVNRADQMDTSRTLHSTMTAVLLTSHGT